VKTIATFLMIVALAASAFFTVGCCGIIQEVNDIGDLIGGGEEEDDSDIPEIPFTDKDDTARELEKNAKELEELAKEYERISTDPTLSEAERQRKLRELEEEMERKGEEMEGWAEDLSIDVE
jgi:hypothetical protein